MSFPKADDNFLKGILRNPIARRGLLAFGITFGAIGLEESTYYLNPMNSFGDSVRKFFKGYPYRQYFNTRGPVTKFQGRFLLISDDQEFHLYIPRFLIDSGISVTETSRALRYGKITMKDILGKTFVCEWQRVEDALVRLEQSKFTPIPDVLQASAYRQVESYVNRYPPEKFFIQRLEYISNPFIRQKVIDLHSKHMKEEEQKERENSATNVSGNSIATAATTTDDVDGNGKIPGEPSNQKIPARDDRAAYVQLILKVMNQTPLPLAEHALYYMVTDKPIMALDPLPQGMSQTFMDTVCLVSKFHDDWKAECWFINRNNLFHLSVDYPKILQRYAQTIAATGAVASSSATSEHESRESKKKIMLNMKMFTNREDIAKQIESIFETKATDDPKKISLILRNELLSVNDESFSRRLNLLESSTKKHHNPNGNFIPTQIIDSPPLSTTTTTTTTATTITTTDNSIQSGLSKTSSFDDVNNKVSEK